MLLVTLLFIFASSLWNVRPCLGKDQQEQHAGESRKDTYKRLKKVVKDNPRDARALHDLGFFFMLQGNGSFKHMDEGSRLLARSFDTDAVDEPLPKIGPAQAIIAAAVVARWRYQIRDHGIADQFAKVAFDLSKHMYPHAPPGQGEPCLHMQLATAIDPFPLSIEHADESLREMKQYADELLDLLQRNKTRIDEDWLSQTYPGAAQDPYVHCVLTLFPLSFYYRADVAAVANLHYRLAAAAFPNLTFTAEHVTDFEEKQALIDSENDRNGGDDVGKPCVDRKIRLGVISATFSEGHSVSEDFGGVLGRLDRNIFKVTYVVVHEKEDLKDLAKFLARHRGVDTVLEYAKQDPGDMYRGAWIRRIADEIAALKLDMALYLDLTMSSYMRRLGMERLAPVQLNTHGHPVTSGHPRSVVQHFVSWAEAELPFETAQTHYTEKLQLIPHGKIHQYYDRPRVLSGKRSRMDGMPFGHLKRRDYGLPEDDDINFYVCMQKPFKMHPEFDELVCGVLQGDPSGHAILHKDDLDSNHAVFLQRLTKAGCDLDRVHFLDVQPNHRLMGLFVNSDVILDSYPAGGCTTTREALELGRAVVTWPARLLGGRWSVALYNIIDLDEHAKEAVVADSAADYIAKAVALGTNSTLRREVESSITEALPRLFRRQEAVEEWEKILLRVSPVKPCAASASTGKAEGDREAKTTTTNSGQEEL